MAGARTHFDPARGLPSGLVPRGLTRDQAALFMGVSPTKFDQARASGHFPAATLPGGRYDRLLLELAANRLSGILTHLEAESPYDGWKAANG